MADARQSGGSTGDTVRELLDGGELEGLAERLRRRLRARPLDLDLLRRLADVYRQQGKLKAAGEVYSLVAEHRPDDVILARLAAMLQGLSPPPMPALPTPFALFEGFLPDAELDSLRGLVRANRHGFGATAVKRDGVADAMDVQTRRSSSFSELGLPGEGFVARLEARLPDLFQRLQVSPFPASVRSCKVSVYHQGHFFRLHQDRTDGPAASRRYGVIYYFDFPPRRFHGGELVLYDVDQESQLPTASFTTIEPTANMLAVIPAGAWHEVLPIVCQSDDWYAGRFTLSGWIHDEDDPVG